MDCFGSPTTKSEPGSGGDSFFQSFSSVSARSGRRGSRPGWGRCPGTRRRGSAETAPGTSRRTRGCVAQQVAGEQQQVLEVQPAVPPPPGGVLGRGGRDRAHQNRVEVLAPAPQARLDRRRGRASRTRPAAARPPCPSSSPVRAPRGPARSRRVGGVAESHEPRGATHRFLEVVPASRRHLGRKFGRSPGRGTSGPPRARAESRAAALRGRSSARRPRCPRASRRSGAGPRGGRPSAERRGRIGLSSVKRRSV